MKKLWMKYENETNEWVLGVKERFTVDNQIEDREKEIFRNKSQETVQSRVVIETKKEFKWERDKEEMSKFWSPRY